MASFDDDFQTALATESWCLYSIGISIIFFRMYARTSRIGFKKLQADDYVMVLAAAWYTLLVGSVNAVAAAGATNLLRPGDRVVEFAADEVATRVEGAKMVVLMEQAQLHTLVLLRLCLLLHYTRLMPPAPPPPTPLAPAPQKPHPRSRLLHSLTRALAAYTLVGYLAMQLAFFCACIPFAANWALPVPHLQCATRSAFAGTLAAFELSADGATLALGLLVLGMVGRGGGAGLAGLLGWGAAGLFVSLALLLSPLLTLASPATNAAPALLWLPRGASYAAILLNLPLLWPLLREWFPCLRTRGVPGSGCADDGSSGGVYSRNVYSSRGVYGGGVYGRKDGYGKGGYNGRVSGVWDGTRYSSVGFNGSWERRVYGGGGRRGRRLRSRDDMRADGGAGASLEGIEEVDVEMGDLEDVKDVDDVKGGLDACARVVLVEGGLGRGGDAKVDLVLDAEVEDVDVAHHHHHQHEADEPNAPTPTPTGGIRRDVVIVVETATTSRTRARSRSGAVGDEDEDEDEDGDGDGDEDEDAGWVRRVWVTGGGGGSAS
ncbi:uncharacterized protein K452DRAFT_294079 [Aplosporella prunicola CBS 121167]|uniref:Rhodopsin domain-containing protein n=1 Tax=Aplosporella prunicola CBS 121167 TaxID=1176127 RepID=A0A6A6BV22_9PEZI|nr:uncharacterized protein K452DRAFT_294079 [Aplosporella prunicola CBS 121167]KAF2146511.1 hypothetical protein K452DRAFT_294079 [Aplosporella prunicola CBS 121167]